MLHRAVSASRSTARTRKLARLKTEIPASGWTDKAMIEVNLSLSLQRGALRAVRRAPHRDRRRHEPAQDRGRPATWRSSCRSGQRKEPNHDITMNKKGDPTRRYENSTRRRAVKAALWINDATGQIVDILPIESRIPRTAARRTMRRYAVRRTSRRTATRGLSIWSVIVPSAGMSPSQDPERSHALPPGPSSAPPRKARWDS